MRESHTHTHTHTQHLNNKHPPTHTAPNTPSAPTPRDTADEMTVGVGDDGSQDLSPLTATPGLQLAF